MQRKRGQMIQEVSGEIIEKVKTSIRIETNAFDDEIKDMILSALLDLGIAGVTNTEVDDPLILRAVTTYCKVHFGEPDDREWLKQSYDEQKAQLQTATGYTNWGE